MSVDNVTPIRPPGPPAVLPDDAFRAIQDAFKDALRVMYCGLITLEHGDSPECAETALNLAHGEFLKVLRALSDWHDGQVCDNPNREG